MQALLLSLAIVVSSGLASAQERRGSIYNPTMGPYGLTANKSASRRGDLVTILISETTDVKEEENSDFSHSTDLSYSLTSFNLKPDAFSVLPDLAANSTDDFKGESTLERKGNFTARLTAMVVDALPNGNLVIRGRREIRVDDQVKTIEFSGIVRRYDITQGNTVESELVAEAKVSYSGVGPATESQNRQGLGGLVHSVIVWIWPF
ncbi:MAG: flagellar L-ring protein precursor FlgH [Planctomycetota bacterium]|jgi:flagellar L-ring protein precursor FlgH